MPDITGSLNPPRLATPPASPVRGQMYFDTSSSNLFFWNGTIWVAAAGGGTVYDSDQIGVVKAWPGQTIPPNWMLADGRLLSRASYPDLFAAIGTTWGAGDGSTTFAIPDLRSRTLVGANAVGSPALGAGLTTHALADAAGEEAHLLGVGELPGHTHNIPGHTHNFNVNSGYISSDHGHNINLNTGTESVYHQHNVQNLAPGNAALLLYGNAMVSGHPGAYTSPGSGNQGSDSQNQLHYHNVSGGTSGVTANHYHNVAGGTDGGTGGATDAGTGGGATHNNMPPWCAVSLIIKATGVQMNSGGALQGATGQRGAIWYLYSSSGTPPAGTFVGELDGDWCIRQSDGENFKRVGGVWVDQGFTNRSSLAPTEARLYYNGGSVAITASTWSKVPFNATTFDTANGFQAATSRWYAPTTGYYKVVLNSLIGTPSAGTYMEFAGCIAKNGAVPSLDETVTNPAVMNYGQVIAADTIQMNAGDYVEGWAYIGATGCSFLGGSNQFHWMTIELATAGAGPQGQRGSNWFTYGGAGTPVAGTFAGELDGDVAVRASDGEVFKRISGAWVDQGWKVQSGQQAMDIWHQVGGSGEPAFQNGWGNYGSNYAPAQFRKYPDGTVRIRGLVSGGTGSAAVFTLPPGYRPATNQQLIFSTDVNAEVHSRLEVYPSGTVLLIFGSGGNNGYCSINTTFDTDTVTVMGQGSRGSNWFTYNGAGTPAAGTFTGELDGDLAVRASDSEVFKRTSGAWIDQGYKAGGALGQSPVAAKGQKAAGAMTINSWTKVPLDTAVFDTLGSIHQVANGRLVVPYTGIYHVDGMVGEMGSNDFLVELVVNGVTDTGASQRGTRTPSGYGNGVISTTARFSAGDVLELYAYAPSATTLNVMGGVTCWLALAMVQAGAGPAGPAGSAGPPGSQWFTYAGTGTPAAGTFAGEKDIDLCVRSSDGEVFKRVSGAWVDQGYALGYAMQTAARAFRTAALTCTTGWNKIPVDTASYDPGNNLQIANGRYICPVAGYYQVSGQVEWGATAATVSAIAGIYKNGVNVAYGTELNVTGNSANGSGRVVSDLLQCNAGDYIELWGWVSVNFSLNNNNPAVNYLSVVKVDVGGRPGTGWKQYTGGGTPTITGINGDTAVRTADGEVFQMTGGVWVDQGWSVQGASQKTTARAFRTAAFTTTANAGAKVPIDTLDFDTSGGMQIANGRFVAPAAGYYQVDGQLMEQVGTGNASLTFIAMLYVNGAERSTGTRAANSDSQGYTASVVTDILKLNAGDYVELWAYSTGGWPLYVGAAHDYNFLAISLISATAVQQQALQPASQARAYRNAAFTLPSSTWTKIPVDTAQFDAGGNLQLANNRYVCPVAGYYQVDAQVHAASGAPALAIYKNGTYASQGEAAGAICNASDLIQCAAGDYLEAWAWISPATALTVGDYGGNFLSVSLAGTMPTSAPASAARAHRTAAFAPPASTWTKVPLDTIGFDPGANFQLGTSRYLCPVAGTYDVSGAVYFSVSGTGTYTAIATAIYKNGVQVDQSFNQAAISASSASVIADKIQCNAGDYLELWCYNSQGTGLYVGPPSALFNYLSVSLLTGSQAGPAGTRGSQWFTYTGAGAPAAGTFVGEGDGDYSVRTSDSEVFKRINGVWTDQAYALGAAMQTAARAYRNNALALPYNAATKVAVDTASFDPGGNLQIANGRYVCPVAGYYQVEGGWLASSPGGTGESIAYIYRNGARVTTGAIIPPPVAGNDLSPMVSDIVQCAAGDYLELWAYTNIAATNFEVGTSGANYLSVVKIDVGGRPGTGWKQWAGSGTPTITGINGDMAVRTADGEVFQMTAGAWTDQNWSLVGANLNATVAARAYRNAAFTVASGWNKLPLDTRQFDPGSNFQLANNRYVCPVAGYYHVDGNLTANTPSAGLFMVSVYKNGASCTSGGGVPVVPASSSESNVGVSDVVQCNAGDYLELWSYSSAAGVPLYVGSTNNYLAVTLVAATAIQQQPLQPASQARAYRNTALTGAAGTYNKIPIDTPSYDAGQNLQLANSRYVCPVAGYYQVNGEVAWGPITASVDTLVHANVFVNGSVAISGNVAPRSDNAGYIRASVSDIMRLNAGDYIELYSYTSGAFPLFISGGQYNYLSVSLVGTVPTAAPANAARASRNAALTLPANAWAKVPFDTISFDPGGNFSLTNNRYVCPVAGIYQVDGQSSVNSNAASQLLASGLYKNGSSVATGVQAYNTATVQTLDAPVSDKVQCNAGDYLELWCFANAALALNVGTSIYNFMSVSLLTAAPAPLPVTTPQVVTTSLPSNPVDGQECYFVADPTNGVMWHLKYRAADPSTHKWLFVGGSSLFSEVVGAQSLGNTSGSWAAMTSAPSITIPITGDYEIAFGGHIGLASGDNAHLLPYYVGDTPGNDDALMYGSASNNDNDINRTLSLRTLPTGAVTMQYALTSAAARVYSRCWMTIKPRRVG